MPQVRVSMPLVKLDTPIVPLVNSALSRTIPAALSALMMSAAPGWTTPFNTALRAAVPVMRSLILIR